MNDFTKEELYSLESTIKNMRIYSGIELWDEELLIKIQSMLDNYKCKHERVSPVEMLNLPLHCLDCGEKFE